jgi:hypothetical protein
MLWPRTWLHVPIVFNLSKRISSSITPMIALVWKFLPRWGKCRPWLLNLRMSSLIAPRSLPHFNYIVVLIIKPSMHPSSFLVHPLPFVNLETRLLSAKTHRRASIGNMRARRLGASIRRPYSSHVPWGWSSLGVPPDLYLVKKVFDVLQLVSYINRHM